VSRVGGGVGGGACGDVEVVWVFVFVFMVVSGRCECC
jgi:hypothetical protein